MQRQTWSEGTIGTNAYYRVQEVEGGSMSERFSKFIRFAAIIAVLALATTSAFAGRDTAVTATLTETCTNCQTDQAKPNGDYSLLSDGLAYSNGGGVQSSVLTSGSVYTLDTLDTLVDGLVGGGTRTVSMHFFSSVEGQFPNNVLPGCWNGNHDQNQAVNWSIISDRVKFSRMAVGGMYSGFARLDFNVRPDCDKQIFRYYLKWYDVCIERTAIGWNVTSDSCGKQTNYGEAGLYGQGGRKGQTQYYGDWRMPFKMTLSQ
jgi:hypothetical protein